MRILQLGKHYPPRDGGMETYLRVLCEELSKEHEVCCVVVDEKTEGRGVNPRVLRFRSVFRHPLSLRYMKYVRMYADAYDVVHLHMPNPLAELSVLFARPKRLVVTYHAEIVNKMFAGAYRLVQEMVLRRADRIIVSSPSMVKRLRGFEQKVRVVPIGVRFGASNPGKVRSATTNYLFVGRLVPYKGVDVLVRAMRDVDGMLTIVGDGPEAGRLRELCALLSLSGRISFLGRVSDKRIRQLYRDCDVFVLPSVTRAEAYGIVQLEAMACGKPVIGTKLGTGVEFVNVHEKTGLIVSPGDVDALADAMNRMRDSRLRERLGGHARKRARLFSVERMVRSTLKAYH